MSGGHGRTRADGVLPYAGRAAKQRAEAMTDRLAAAPYDALSPTELDRLVTDVEPISAAIPMLLPW